MHWTQKEVSLPGWAGPRKREDYLDGLDQERGKSNWMGWTQKKGSLPGWVGHRKREVYLDGLDPERVKSSLDWLALQILKYGNPL
jgi:hypothetical protein